MSFVSIKTLLAASFFVSGSLISAVASGAPLLQQISPTPTTYQQNVDYQLFTGSGVTYASFLGDVTAPLQLVPDLGCNSTDFAGFTAGNIALIVRGICEFDDKVNNADVAGAVGALIYNNLSGLVGGGGVALNSETFIPSLFITDTLGADLVAALRQGSVVMRLNNVPEPATLALLGLGLAGLAAARRRKQ